MPGFILHVGATVLCAHGGQAQPTAPNPRVTVSGQPIGDAGGAARGGGLPVRGRRGAEPCVTAQWTIGATRVSASGVPVLVRQSGGLRAERHTRDGCDDANARQCAVATTRGGDGQFRKPRNAR